MTVEIAAALIAALVSILVFWGSHRLATRAARRERRRKAIEDWLRSLSDWVDQYAELSNTPDYSYNNLTSREIIELSLARKDRFLAWWMHEMAVAIMLRRRKATESWSAQRYCVRDLNNLLRETGTALISWHHGALKSSDFNIPYKLRVNARNEKIDVGQYAKNLKLDDFVVPAKMTLKRRRRVWSLIANPETGASLLNALESFIARNYVYVGLLAAIARVPLIKGKIVVQRFKIRSSTQRLRWMEQQLEELESSQNTHTTSTDN